VRLSDTPSVELRPAPTLGQHTDEILEELGYPPERIAMLRETEVILKAHAPFGPATPLEGTRERHRTAVLR